MIPLNHHEHFISTVDPFLERKSLVPGNDDAESDEESDNDYLQHSIIYHRLEQVGREDIYYCVHEARRLCSFIFQRACLQDLICSLENVRKEKSDNDGERCSAEVINDSTESDSSYLLDVRERYNTLNYRSDYDRYYDELEQVEEDSTKWLDISFGKICCP